MVIDESTAKAQLKKWCKIFDRKNREPYPDPKKSRRKWKLNTIRDIRKCNFVIHEQDDVIFALSPVENGHFYTSMYTLDCKKCDIELSGLRINFTRHVLVRMMQYYKTLDLHTLTPIINHILHEAVDKDLRLDEPRNLELYINGLGLFPIVVDNEQAYIKTFIDNQALRGQQKINYKKAPILLDI